MSERHDHHASPKRAHEDVPQGRACLRCRKSEGVGERICRQCKGTNSWRTSVQTVRATGRRR